MPTYHTLNTGAQIPALGFGTWQDADAQEAAVAAALQAGCRHIDTARIYGTEPAVGAAIARSGVPRSELFVTTKLWNNAHHPDDVAAALDASLRDLGLEYVDLYLMHNPVAWARGDALNPVAVDGRAKLGETSYVDTYKAMEKLLEKGKAKAIGISNFSQAEMDKLLSETTIVPAVHQLELHPWLQQKVFVQWHAERGIHLTAYSPFGNQNEAYERGKGMGKLIDDPVLQEVAAQCGKSAAQVALAWHINAGRSVLTKSKTEMRIKHNFESDFVLAPALMDKLATADRKIRFLDYSDWSKWDYFADLEGKKR